jgi:hypothetical protein
MKIKYNIPKGIIKPIKRPARNKRFVFGEIGIGLELAYSTTLTLGSVIA